MADDTRASEPQVIVTDSGPAHEAVQRLFPALSPVLQNGEDRDWTDFTGRRFVIAFAAGREAEARELAGKLLELAAEVRLVLPEPDRERGWSIADEPTWDSIMAGQWARKNAETQTAETVRILTPDPAPQGTSASPPPPEAAEGFDFDGAGPMQEAPTASQDDGPPPDHPSIAAPPLGSPERPKRRRRAKPDLSLVEGNLARGPDHDDAPLPAKLSDDALADYLAEQHSENWRYVAPWGRWFHWDGDGWRQDDTQRIDRVCIEFTREAVGWPEARALPPKDQRKLNSRATAAAVRGNLGNDRRIVARLDQWDCDPWLLGCPGGVLDLRSGKMIEAERGQYITKRCAIAPASGAPARWLKFLDTVTGGDTSLRDYLQRFAGYAMTGETSEHSLAFLYGTGANGKTVFLQTLSGILGDYAVSAGIETFTETKNERHSTEIARLRGARLVVTEETDSGGKWAEGKIKRLTGGGKISAHFMRQDDFEFTPQFKLMIAGNHKPMLRSVDEAIRRRFHLVPFAVTIPIEERDKHLMETLREEWPQILGWMLQGCVAWQECALGMPEAIQDATDKYLEAEDTLGMWMDDCCERDGSCESALAYRNYADWAERQGERPWSRRAWINALIDRGFTTKRTASARMIAGLSLKLGGSPVPRRDAD